MNCVLILMGIVLNMLIDFGRNAIFIMLILPLQEHVRSFDFLISSSRSFFKDLKVLSHIMIFDLSGIKKPNLKIRK